MAAGAPGQSNATGWTEHVGRAASEQRPTVVDVGDELSLEAGQAYTFQADPKALAALLHRYEQVPVAQGPARARKEPPQEVLVASIGSLRHRFGDLPSRGRG